MTKPKNSELPIGVFDSGIGGLTVLKELVKTLPHESYLYFGDTARLPYGNKNGETIIRYSIENSIFLLNKNIKVLVVACNTASAYALERLQQIFNIPIVGVIEPGVERALQVTTQGKIAVLGTRGLIDSQSYQKAFLQKASDIFVLPIACPLLAPLVEEHYIDHPATRLIIRDYLKTVKEYQIDTLLLGCTHYPLLKDVIREELGEDIHIVDSAITCAEKVSETITQRGLHQTPGELPKHHYFVSDDPVKFQKLGCSLVQLEIDHVELVKI